MSPIWKIFLFPKRSPKSPAINIKPDKVNKYTRMVHCAISIETSSELAIRYNEILTTELSTTAMNTPIPVDKINLVKLISGADFDTNENS